MCQGRTQDMWQNKQNQLATVKFHYKCSLLSQILEIAIQLIMEPVPNFD